MSCNHLIRIFVLLVCNTFARVNCSKSSHKTSAVFYQTANKGGYKISYKEDPVGWTDIQNLFYNNKQIHSEDNPELLCISGIWLSYEHPLYMASNNDTVKLIAGKDICISPSELGTIGSMQALTTMVGNSDDTISLFTRPNFGSLAKTISAKESGKSGLKQLDEDFQDIGSLILVGDKSWSLISSNKKVICIRPLSQDGNSICYGKDEIQIADFHVSAVYPGCPDEDDESVVYIHKLTDCKQFGSEKPESLTNTVDMMGRSLGGGGQMLCRYNITWNSTKFTEEETALIAKLLTIRMTHDFEDTEQILWPDAAEDIWKTGPLDTAFDIMMATVPPEIVNIQFLKIVREFTVYHLNEVWKCQREDGISVKHQNWRRHKVLAHLLNVCLKRATKTKSRYTEVIKSAYNKRTSLEEFNDKIDPDFNLDLKHDPIIEMAYVVSNYAMALCHHLYEYKINFWDNFITTFGQLYFGQLQTRWKIPDVPAPKTWGVILSGFGVETQHRRIAFATSRIFELTPKLEPFEKNLTVNVITSTM